MKHKILYGFCILLFLSVLPAMAKTDTFPSGSFTFVTGFGVAGNSDRMARVMAPFFSHASGQLAVIDSRIGGSGNMAAHYVLEKPADGYTILASSFSPYIALNTLHKNSGYTLDDLAFINIQWQDSELIAAPAHSPYRSLADIINRLRKEPGSISAAVVRNSTGHLLLKMIQKKAGLAPGSIHLVFCHSDEVVRRMALGSQVDIIAVSSMGTEFLGKMLHPIAISCEKRDPAWDTPTVKEALAPLGLEIPLIPGVLRGFAVSADVKRNYPEHFDTLVEMFRQATLNPNAQKLFQEIHMGKQWLGPEKSQNLMLKNQKEIEKYKELIGE
ncbi:hypothetical protein JWG39_03530 [Desulforhopalus vacuolatus]|uniref:tripartite tricarboxylate transporter substrate-binding protein n=1 Tax=Desulforhopalus vacuolatus TaxID=40414 RepID=UPI001964CFC3|nr:tripartite tricarboxylate transporter substrate-binding protein [Desulforhopalus vacuolatus]MBM9518885.1 hypothetical protein [Desulforhopalus vacuolatus]